jgi:hypothetical protein
MTWFVYWWLFTSANSVNAPADRPACTAAIRGTFWTAAANESNSAATAIFRQGSLFLCTKGPWRHSWRQLTVNVKELIPVSSAGSRFEVRREKAAAAKSTEE